MSATKKQKQISAALYKFYDNPVSKVSVELFLTIGTIVFFALFAIRPTLLTMANLVKEIEDKKELDKKLIQKIAALSSAQNQYYALEPRIQVLDEAVPATPQLINTLKIIEKITSEQNLVITGLKVNEIPEEASGAANLSKLERKNLSFQLSVQGDYPAIKTLVEKLQASRRVLTADTIVFNVADNRGEKSLSATITINAPYFGQ